MKALASFVVRTIGFCVHFAWWVIAAAIVLTLAASWYSVTHFAMTTDINQLISSTSPGRQREIRFEKAFPQFDSIIVVVDAPTPEMVEAATAALVRKLTPQKNLFRSIEQQQGGAFFAQNGLLFVPVDQLAPQLKGLSEAQRLVQNLAGDPSLRGVVRALQFGLLGVQGGQLKLDDMTWPMTLAADTLDHVLAHEPASFSWHTLVRGEKPKAVDLLRFLKIVAVLDYSELQPGLKASDAIRQAAADLDLASDYQARVRLTGPVPMNDDEFATIKENAGLNATVTIAIVLCILWLALRWFRVIFAVVVSLIVGLSLTAALGMLLVGTLNLISVYFAVLFVGLGVDFGLQYSVRYRAERHEVDGVREALAACRPARRRAADAGGVRHRGRFPVVPADRLQGLVRARTDRRPRHADRLRHQHQRLAGAGEPPQAAERAAPARLRRARAGRQFPGASPRTDPDRDRADHSRGVAAALLAALRFQSDEFAQSKGRVGRDLLAAAEGSDFRRERHRSIGTVLDGGRRDRGEAAGAAPSGARGDVVDVHSGPSGRQAAADRERGEDLDPALNRTIAKPPTDADNIAIVNSTVDVLNRLAGNSPGRGADAAHRLAGDMAKLAKAEPEVRQRAEAAFVVPLHTALGDMRELLEAHEVTRDNLPSDLVAQWVTPDGHARVMVSPAGNQNDNVVLRTFAHAVQAVAPNATEGPISILEARATIITAFIEAGAYALLSIAVLLWITLRRVGDVLLTLIPLLVAGVVTLEISVAIDLPLNFANIIALPLLLGVGVAFKIYYIMAWREGQTRLLQSVLTRAVSFSACTTATAFGSLWFSSDPGTSSMGKLLALSLLTTMAAAALFQPVLMGKPRQEEAPAGRNAGTAAS